MPSLTTYKLLKQEHDARRGEFKTVHGTVQTPAFQNVATAGAIKGGLSAQDLKSIGTQVMLCNTYHLHLRPGDKLVADMGGLHKFTRWDGPILTDSGGFQVFSLAKLRKITEEGVTFASHLDGHRIFMGPEESMQIQANLGSTIAMAFDECVENPAQHDYCQGQPASAPSAGWPAARAELARLKHEGRGHQSRPAAIRHQSGLHLRRLACGAHEADRRAGSGRLRHRRPCGGRAHRGDVPR